MSGPLIVAAVIGGGIIIFLRRMFPRNKSVHLLQYPVDIMRGKTVIVTGANSGIGKAVALELLKLRARVILACRDPQRAEEAAEYMKKQAGPDQGEVVIKQLDLASLKSVHSFCQEIIKVCYV